MKYIFLILLVLLPMVILGQSTESLTLADAVSIALKNNYGINIQSTNLAISRKNNSWGTVGALPTISLSGSKSNTWNYSDDDDVTIDKLSGTVNFNWVLFRGFGARIDKSKLNEVEKLTEGNLAVVVENTLSNVIQAYYGVLLQSESMKIAEKLMLLSEDRYKMEDMKTSMGASVTYNLLQAKNSFLEDKSNFLAARLAFNNSIRQLNFLMAAPLEKQYDFTAEFKADTTEFSLEDLTQQMLANNRTLRNQYINLELSKLEVKAARSDFSPTVSLSGSGGYSKSETEYAVNSILNSSSSGYNASASLGVSFDLFTGGQKRRALQIAKLEQDIAEIEITEIQQELKNQLAQEFERYNVRKEMLVLADENLKAAELNLEISRQKYETGAINSFNYRDINLIYFNAALMHRNAIYDLIESYHVLLRLTGGLLQEYQ